MAEILQRGIKFTGELSPDTAALLEASTAKKFEPMSATASSSTGADAGGEPAELTEKELLGEGGC
eukprot:14138918-Alexandrium_andersonii.AAC.1